MGKAVFHLRPSIQERDKLRESSLTTWVVTAILSSSIS